MQCARPESSSRSNGKPCAPAVAWWVRARVRARVARVRARVRARAKRWQALCTDRSLVGAKEVREHIYNIGMYAFVLLLVWLVVSYTCILLFYIYILCIVTLHTVYCNITYCVL